MKTNNLSKVGTDNQVYYPPICEVILDETQSIICESETETVGETEGEW